MLVLQKLSLGFKFFKLHHVYKILFCPHTCIVGCLGIVFQVKIIFLQRVRLHCCFLTPELRMSSHIIFIVSLVANLVFFGFFVYLSLEVKVLFFFVHVLRCCNHVCCT